MIFSLHGRIGRFLHQQTVARWKSAVRDIESTRLRQLEIQSGMAQKLLRHLREFDYEAQAKLAMPRPGSTVFQRPSGTDWSWRPKAWRARITESGIAPAWSKAEFTKEIVIFHDCKSGEISLNQSRNLREVDLAPYAVNLEVFHFEGSYLSIVIEIPKASCEGLKKRHLIRVAAYIEREQPTKIYARLNVKHGPNTEQILLTLPDDTAETMVEFDLAYTQMIEQRAERMWLDLMIENPAMNKIKLRDLNFSRYPRAEI